MKHSTAQKLTVTEKSLPTHPLPHGSSDEVRTLKSTMGQTWLQNLNNNTWSDQYGFVIERINDLKKPFQLTKGDGQTLGQFCHLETAQLVSTIIINDMIF
jgi:hypothetical protein